MKGDAYANKFSELLECLAFLELNDALEKIDQVVMSKVILSILNVIVFLTLNCIDS